MSTWRQLITERLSDFSEDWLDVVACTLDDAGLDLEFDDGFGNEEGSTFTVWTATRVYFPATYDGNEWVASVSRHPDGKPTEHVGGS
jgi:hypothetical protein